MDVTCERCGTEYEFDETLVSDRGTTVKCTNCGHLFKVFRPGSGPAGDRNWSIRRRDGTTLVLTSLRELQKLITKGELAEDDEISRSGEGWKPLGSIAELGTFFAAARAAAGQKPDLTRKDSTLPFDTGPAAAPFKKSPSAAPPPRHDVRAFARTEEMDRSVPPAPSRGSQSGPLPAPPSAGPPRSGKGTIMGVGAGPSSAPPPPRSAKGTIMGVGSSAPPPPDAAPASPQIPPPAAVPSTGGQVRKATPSPRSAPTRPESVDRTADERPRGRAIVATREAPFEDRPTTPTDRPRSARPGGGRPSERPSNRPLYIDESDEAVRPRRGSRAGLWIGLVVLLVAAGGVALSWERIAPMLGMAEAEDPLAPFLARGDEALSKDHPEAYGDAIREYTRGTAIDERDPRILARLALAHTLLAQALDFQADDLEARAAADPALAGEAAALRREQRRNADEGRRLAEDAVRQNANHIEAVVTLADALRMTGDASGARSHLDRAETIEPEATAERLRVEALLAMEQAGGDVSAAGDGAAAAIEKDPASIRARLLYARALLADGNVAQARGQIDVVLRDHPQHPGALHLKDAIDRGLPPAAPVVAVLDAGTADAGTAEEPPAEVAEAQAAAEEESGGGGGGTGGIPRGRDYSWYIRSGDEALERSDVGRARALFDAALEQRPGGSEALNGLGYVMIETGNASGAAQRFRQASSQGYAPAYIGLGAAYRAMGQTENAANAYRSYLERLPNGPQSSIARSQLAQLGASESSSGGGESGGGSGGDGAGSGGGGAGSGGGESGAEPAPPTPPDSLPAPRGTDPDNPPPESDPPAVGSE